MKKLILITCMIFLCTGYLTVVEPYGVETRLNNLETVKSCNGNGFLNWTNGTYASCGNISIPQNYGVNLNSGLILRGINLSLMNCSNNQILKNVSGGWFCSSDDVGLSVPYWITLNGNTTSNRSINNGSVTVSKNLIVNDSVMIRTTKSYANGGGLILYTSSSYPNDPYGPVPLLLVGTSQTSMAFYSGSAIQAYMKSDDAGNMAGGSKAAFIIETGGFGYAYERMQVSSTGQVLIHTRAGDSTSALQVEGKINGGSLNSVSGLYSVIPGGTNNIASGDFSAVMGGYKNTASGFYSAVGGSLNSVSGLYSVIPGGTNNIASGDYSAVMGGYKNTASGIYSAVLGGMLNTASGKYSTAIGHNAVANQDDSFVIQFDAVKYVFNKSGIYNSTGERIGG